MDKKEALTILNANIKQADEFCGENYISPADKQYLEAIKIARDTLGLVVELQRSFNK